MNSASKLFAISAVVMGISYTITRERLFAGLRTKLGGRETWLGYLFSCPYCASHWIAFLVVPLTGASDLVPVIPQLGWAAPILSWFFSSILVTVVAAFLRIGFFMVDETQALVRRRKEKVEQLRTPLSHGSPEHAQLETHS